MCNTYKFKYLIEPINKQATVTVVAVIVNRFNNMTKTTLCAGSESRKHFILRSLVLFTVTATVVVGGFFVSRANAYTPPSVFVDGVQQIANSSNTTAAADNTYEHGWKWVFYVTVPDTDPHNETLLKMKFADWMSGNDVILSGGNMRFYSAQSTNAVDEAHAIAITSSTTWSDIMNINSGVDLNSLFGGRQIEVVVEAKIPTGSAGGSYSTSYDINTTATSSISFDGLNQTYNGTPRSVSVTTVPSGLANTVTYTGVDVTYGPSTTAPTHAGTYSVLAAVTDPGYTGTSSATMTISPAEVTVTADAKNKVYDRATSTDPALTYHVTPALFSGDTLSGALAREGQDTIVGENVGTYAIATGTLALSADYALTFVPASFVITPKALSIAGVTVNNKVYDGNTTATLGGEPSLTGVVDPDAVTLGGTPAANFDTKDVGTDKAVTISGYLLTGADALNYTLNGLTGLKGDVTPLSITASISATSRAYNGNVDASVSCSPIGIIGSDAVTCSAASASFADKNVGNGKVVTGSGITLGGADKADYDLTDTSTTTTADITSASLTVTANNATKTYGSLHTFLGSEFTVSGLFAGDSVSSVTLTSTGAPVTATVSGSPYPIIASGAIGTGLGNYSINYVAGHLTVNKNILSASITAGDKAFDGTTAATLTGCTPIGILNSDVVQCSATNGTFDNKNVGANRVVTANVSFTGAVDNYDFATTATTTANITARPITVTAQPNAKVYDHTTVATATPQITSGSFVSGDTATFTEAYADASVGTGKTLTPSLVGTISDGNSGNNYSVTFENDTTGIIIALPVVVTAVGHDKIYDGTTAAQVTFTVNGAISGDTVTATGTATFNDKNAGSNKPINVSSITLQGSSAGNYTSANTSTTTLATILPRELLVIVTADNKIYDGTTVAIAHIMDNRLPIDVGNPNLADSYQHANFEDKNVGDNKIVTIDGLWLYGSEHGNYNMVDNSTTTTANITARGVTGTFIVDSKVYDGTANASSSCSLSAIISGDSVNCATTNSKFNTRNVGTNTVTANMDLTGTDAPNYTLTPTSSTTSATITALHITVTARPNTKVYDTNTTAATTPMIVPGLASGDTASFIETYDTASVGTGKVLTPSGGPVSDGNSGANYAITFAASSTGVITKANQTVSFVTYPNGAIDGNSFVVTAISSSGLPVSFSGGAAGICTVLATTTGTVDVIGSGQCPVTIGAAGDTNHNPAPNLTKTFSVTFHVSAALLTSTNITSNGSMIGTLSGATLTTSGTGSCNGSNSGTSACYTLNVASVQTSPSGSKIPAEEDGFNLQANSTQQATLTSYFSGKGWPSNYVDQMSSEISGSAPFLYFVSDGNGGYSLADGFKWGLGATNQPLVIDDTYPAGTYTFTGNVNGSPVTVTLTVNQVPPEHSGPQVGAPYNPLGSTTIPLIITTDTSGAVATDTPILN